MNAVTSNLSFGSLVRHPKTPQTQGAQINKPLSVSFHQEPDSIHFSSGTSKRTGKFVENEHGNLVWRSNVQTIDLSAIRASHSNQEGKHEKKETPLTSPRNDQSQEKKTK